MKIDMSDYNCQRIFILLIFMSVTVSLVAEDVSAVALENISVPDLNTGTYTRYWYNPDNQQFDGFGFAYSLIAPFLVLLGPWFFVFVWSAIIYRSYERTGNITMPIVLGLLTSTIWGVVIPQEAAMVWGVMFGIGIAALIAKYMLDR